MVMTVKPNNLSKNIINIMQTLSKNEGLARLLVNNVDNPFDQKLPAIDKSKLINPKSDMCKIYPYPFDTDAQVDDTSFIRVYYNRGEFDNSETIHDLELHIDIIVARSLWLINDGRNSLIRPYEIMDRVVDLVGKKSGAGSQIRVDFDGWQHLYVNTQFDSVRLYSSDWKIETNDTV